MLTEEDNLIQIYYDKEEIKANYKKQGIDQFDDVMRMRMSIVAPVNTKINILDHLPTNNPAGKNQLNTSDMKSKKRKNKSMNLKVNEELIFSDDERLARIPTPKHPDVIERERKIAELLAIEEL